MAQLSLRVMEVCLILEGVDSPDALRDSRKERRYYSQLTPKGFSVKTEGDDIRKLDDQENYMPAWAPSLIARGIIFIVVALLIAALEIALRVSEKNDRLGNVSSNDHQHYLWTILPSLVMASVGLHFGRMGFNTRSLAPYARLKWRTDSLAITNIIRSIRAQHFVVLATGLAALVTSFLVIIASGLYFAIEVSHQISMNFIQETTSYMGNSANADQSSSIVVAKDNLQKNLTFPHWTYDGWSSRQSVTRIGFSGHRYSTITLAVGQTTRWEHAPLSGNIILSN
ncbi:hypothetical protein N7537_009411 [Penicillium hordei]|uniref:Uncharacterized protein n=1 Tax=Penicillium hordei TaxID=40994 RepID=A0AAD6DSS5_9EURO|nr:uncharacterized protein N7537_009411 [Penicillium hordei]KAJ5592507.1 hypothetical protein N7537_009411 [Penicillium hordei]